MVAVLTVQAHVIEIHDKRSWQLKRKEYQMKLKEILGSIVLVMIWYVLLVVMFTLDSGV